MRSVTFILAFIFIFWERVRMEDKSLNSVALLGVSGHEQLLRPVQVHRAVPEEEGRVSGREGAVPAVSGGPTEAGAPPLSPGR